MSVTGVVAGMPRSACRAGACGGGAVRLRRARGTAAARLDLQLRSRVFVMGRHRRGAAAETLRVACGPRVALGRTAPRDCANQRSAPPLDTLPMKISAELLSTSGGTQVLRTKPPAVH